uniref:Uncharacterized protein n=1 Tax=Clandestinovirus TaxID=2831644 RepID=A0A8F8KLL7_9VIRU|nr:hypothetical protein KOM_12_102 [Clandestinovirus]
MERYFPVEIIDKIKTKSNRNAIETEIWFKNKQTLLSYGCSQSVVDSMTYEQFDEHKQEMGLDFMFWVRVCGHSLHVNWDDFITEHAWITEVYYGKKGVYCPPGVDEGFIGTTT